MSRRALRLAAATALLFGCAEPPSPPPGSEPPAPPVAAAPAELADLPRPDLAPLEESVRRQVEQELAELDSLRAEPATPSLELAERFGRLARVYHAYGLLDPASIAYRNARSLDPEDHRWPYLEAVVAQRQGDAEGAERLLRQVLELAPEELPALLRLAELRLLAGDGEAAERLFQSALELQPDNAAALHGQARLASARGDHQAAVRLHLRVLELQPEASSVRALLAQSYRRLGDRESAEAQLAARGPLPVIFDDPLVDGLDELRRGVGIHLERGLRAFGDDRHADAIEEYRAALELEPDHPTALRMLALNLASANRHDEAIATYERMLKAYPDHQLARLEHATVLLERGREEEAIANLKRAIATDPGFKDAHFNLATAYSRLDRWQEAAAGFREVLRLDRSSVEAHYSLAVALDELGDLAEAVAELQRAIDLDPDHLRARQRLGALLERLGRRPEALEQFRAVLELEAPDQEKALAHYQIGRLLAATGRDDEALPSFERAVELFPEFWQARFAVANWLSRHDRHAEAAEIFGRMAAADPSNVLARQREAAALMSAGRFARARQRLEEGLAAHPRSYELASLLARLLAAAPEPSLRDGSRALELSQRLLEARRTIDQAETVAMALAELERYDEAAALQRQILGWAESEGRVELGDRLRRNLERYESRQPVRLLPG